MTMPSLDMWSNNPQSFYQQILVVPHHTPQSMQDTLGTFVQTTQLQHRLSDQQGKSLL